jgi:uncharacterized protein DUF1559
MPFPEQGNAGDLEGVTVVTDLAPMWIAGNGILFNHGGGTVSMHQITDGLSNTYMFGEKYMDPVDYTTGSDQGDILSMLYSTLFGTQRFGDARLPPAQDEAGKSDPRPFGSAHLATWNAVLCDGSVRGIAYTIDPTIHGYLANRHDGNVVDWREL